jgi:hypothetical protein
MNAEPSISARIYRMMKYKGTKKKNDQKDFKNKILKKSKEEK